MTQPLKLSCRPAPGGNRRSAAAEPALPTPAEYQALLEEILQLRARMAVYRQLTTRLLAKRSA